MYGDEKEMSDSAESGQDSLLIYIHICYFLQIIIISKVESHPYFQGCQASDEKMSWKLTKCKV